MTDSKFHQYHEDLTERIYTTPGMLPSRYVFVLTNMCNLRCNFCFQDKSYKENAMTKDDWINLAKQLPEYARVTLTGGEPLMMKDFEEIFSFIAEKFDCNIITNGLLLTKERIDFLLSFQRFKVLSVSIDNIGNKTRGLNSTQWEYLINILKYFIQRKKELNSGCILDIKTMILDENAEQLFEIYKYFTEELGSDTHAFQFLKGSPIQHADYMSKFEDILKKSEAHTYSKFEEIKNQLEIVRLYNLKNKKNSFLHPKYGSLNSNEILDIDIINKKEHFPEKFCKCKFPWSSVHINFDGDLFPCLAVKMGNVKEKSLKEIIEGREFKKFKEVIEKNRTVEACNRCGWLRLKNKKVIHLFGSTGFIGKNIFKHLTSKGYEVKGYSSQECNLLSYESLEKIKINPEEIIIMASSITRLKENSFDAMIKNITMAENLAKFIEKNSIAQLIFLSTSDVYGINAETPINEKTITNPDDYYSSSKLESEFILKRVCLKKNIPLFILRMPGIYGPEDKGISTINKMIECAKKGKITINGDGKDQRDFIHAKDVCEIIEKSFEKKINSIINIGTGKSYEINDIVNLIQKYFPNYFLIEHSLNESNRAKSLAYDVALLKKEFPNLKMTCLEEGIENYIKDSLWNVEDGEIDLMARYPKTKRKVDERGKEKTEEDRIIARKFGKEFFDGERRHGYGGYNYHPRFWKEVVEDMVKYYGLTNESKILDVGCGKGFMLYDFKQALSGAKIKGIDISEYAIENGKPEVKEFLEVGDAKDLSKFKDKEFDLVISINTVHNLYEKECRQAIREIERVGKKAFITVDSWRDEKEKKDMISWNLTAQTFMGVENWKKLFQEEGYKGNYYWFIPLTKEKKKILLTQPNYSIYGKRIWEMLPYSLGILNSCLKKDFETSLLDPNLGNLNDDEIKEKLKEFSPDIVGISTVSTEYMEETKHLTQIIKETLPNAVIIEGGILPTVCLDEAMRDKNVDYWFLREGELRLPEFLKELEKNNPELYKIEGIAYYKDGEKIINDFKMTDGLVHDLDSVPFPDYGDIDIIKYGSKILKYTAQLVPERYPFAIISTSRGCPFMCTFCSGWTVTGRKVRMRSAKNVLAEIDELYNKGIKEIIFLDDHFLFDKTRATEIMEGIIERKYNLKWKCVNVNISDLDDNILELMKKSGSYQITVSIESGNEKVLKNLIKKPFINLDKVPEILKKAKEKGFELISNFVIGYPDETWEQIRETFAYAEKLPIDYAVFHIATPLPKTELMQMYIKKGLIKEGEEISGFCLPLISTKEFTADQLKMLRVLEWDRINFSSEERKKRVAKIQGITLDELEKWRKDTLNKLGVGVVTK